MRFTLPAVIVVIATLSARLDAGSLKGGTVTRIVKDVKVAGERGRLHRIAEQEIVTDGASLHVGVQSRAEIVFADHTLARAGAETVLTLGSNARELSLERGTLLLQVPKFHGGARLRADSLQLSCGGATILVEHLPGKSLKAVVLEGEMRVAVARFLGDSIVVPAGKMLITTPGVRRIPDPVDTDLRTLVSTSTLINSGAGNLPGFAPLASLPQILRAITRQEDAMKGKRLLRTNLVIVGSGTNVIIPAAESGPSDAGAASGSNLETARTSENATRRSAEKGAPLVADHLPAIEPTLPEP